jgi:hypothetical protein
MPWVRFTEAFDWYVSDTFVYAYRSGGEYLVKRICADEAIKAGKAISIERPKKDDSG